MALIAMAGALGVPAAMAGSGDAYVQQILPSQNSAFVEQLSPTLAPRPERPAQPARKTAAKNDTNTPKTAVLELRITDLGAVADGMPLTLPSVRGGVSYRIDPKAAH